MYTPDLNARLTRIFKGTGYNPYREKCGRFTTAENAGSECGVEETTPPMSDEELVDFVAEGGPSRLEGVPLVVEQERSRLLTKNDYEVVLDTLSEEMQDVVDVLEKPDMIVEVGYGFGSYNMRTKTLEANPTSNHGMTFKHEYGHHVDRILAESGSNARTWSAGSMAFRQAFESDRVATGLLSTDPMKALDAAHALMDNNLLEPTGWRRFDLSTSNYLEDIADALSSGHLTEKYGLYGHGKAYFEGKPNIQHEETFANLFALHGNKEAWESVKGMVPRAAKVFEDKMKEVRKR